MSTGLTKKKAAAAAIIILIIHLLFLYFIKYRNQDLPFSLFYLWNTGNLLNLIFTLILLTGIIVYLFQKNNTLKPPVIIFFLFLLSILLIAGSVTLVVELPGFDFYLLEQSFDQFFKALFFVAYQAALLIFISILWLSIFSAKEFIFLRVLINSVIILLALLFFAFFYLELQKDDEVGILAGNKSRNVAVVLGAAVWSGNIPSPSLASRLEKAVELYKRGIVEKVQLTGSNAPGESSEAEVALVYILKKEMDIFDILIEKNTTSTNEQIRFIKYNLLQDKIFDNVIIISDEYHLSRIKEISKFYKADVKVVSSELEVSFYKEVYYRIRESIALVIFWLFAV